MDRVINYPGAIPLDTDLLQTNKNTMIALGYAMQAILGTGTYVDGLACTPTSPPSLGVSVGTGSIYSLAGIDATAYGTLAADTADQILKQGIVIGSTPFTITPPSTSGQSVVYLVQAQFQEVDGGSVVLPYYNASNPAVAYSGPGGSGLAQNTNRQGKCILSLKVGTIAPTGSQVSPAPDAGYTGLWTITVPHDVDGGRRPWCVLRHAGTCAPAAACAAAGRALAIRSKASSSSAVETNHASKALHGG